MPGEVKLAVPLPCPVCGGTAKIVVPCGYLVMCKECGLQTRAYAKAIEAVIAWNRRAYDIEMLHALKNASVALSYMPCGCGHGFVCGRCNTFKEIDALLKNLLGGDWEERGHEQYARDNPEAEYGD